MPFGVLYRGVLSGRLHCERQMSLIYLTKYHNHPTSPHLTGDDMIKVRLNAFDYFLKDL